MNDPTVPPGPSSAPAAPVPAAPVPAAPVPAAPVPAAPVPAAPVLAASGAPASPTSTASLAPPASGSAASPASAVSGSAVPPASAASGSAASPGSAARSGSGASSAPGAAEIVAESAPGRAGAGGRGLAAAVVACVAGAGLAIFAATRVWAVAVTTRPGLTDLRESTTGAAAQGWIVALGLVALAGAGALLATRGVLRRGLGGLLVLVGAGLAVAALTGRAGLDAGEAGAGAFLWPAACVAGSALIMLGGLSAARRGHRWPAMGSRYERTTAPSPHARPGEPTGPSGAAGPKPDVTAPDSRVDTRAAWDALDRGDDPTT